LTLGLAPHTRWNVVGTPFLDFTLNVAARRGLPVNACTIRSSLAGIARLCFIER
jgi:hypothetical protein